MAELVELETAPPKVESCLLSFPAPYVLLVTMNREKAMNSIPFCGHWEMDEVSNWFDQEPNLRVAVLTGAGSKAFCAGQDLIELGKIGRSEEKPPTAITRHPPSGFASVSRRTGKKPIIAAVNGVALGGGFEICLNCDMVVASPDATFGLPEALRGIYAAAGGLPRIMRNCGLQVASEIAMTGRKLTAQEAKDFRLVNKVSETPESVVEDALGLAKTVADISPDAIIVTRASLREAWETSSVERATVLSHERYHDALLRGDNAREGLAAFAEKRRPNWKPSKL